MTISFKKKKDVNESLQRIYHLPNLIFEIIFVNQDDLQI